MPRIVQFDHVGGDLLGLAAEACAGCKATGERCIAACALAEQIAIAQDGRAASGHGCAQLVGCKVAARKAARQFAGALQLGAQRFRLHFQFAECGEQVKRLIQQDQPIRPHIVKQTGGLAVGVGKIPFAAVKALACRQVVHLQPQFLAQRQHQAPVAQRRIGR